MRKLMLFFIFGIIFFFGIVFYSPILYGIQKTKWKGTIEKEDGVTIIKNPKEPLFGTIKFELDEDLSIGSQTEEKFMFYRIKDIQVDKEGNIYVLDTGNFNIKKFDKNGRHIVTIGRKGQGPAEFQWPFNILLDEKNERLFLKDAMKLIIFNKEGTYLDKDIYFDKFVSNLSIDPKGNLWGTITQEESLNMFHALCKFNIEGKIETIYDKFPYISHREKTAQGVTSISTGYESDIFYLIHDNKNIIYGYSKFYQLYLIGRNGDLKSKIECDIPPNKFTEIDKSELRGVELPEYKPYFYRIFSDSKKRIYVQRNNSRMVDSEMKEFDIFSSDGYYLYKVTFLSTPFLIREGFLYTVLIDENTGDVFLKRYKIKNWDQIKTEISN